MQNGHIASSNEMFSIWLTNISFPDTKDVQHPFSNSLKCDFFYPVKTRH